MEFYRTILQGTIKITSTLKSRKTYIMKMQKREVHEEDSSCSPKFKINVTIFPSEYCNLYSREKLQYIIKPAFCICENKNADQIRGNREADQRLCFRYTDSTIPLLAKSKIACL